MHRHAGVAGQRHVGGLLAGGLHQGVEVQLGGEHRLPLQVAALGHQRVDLAEHAQPPLPREHRRRAAGVQAGMPLGHEARRGAEELVAMMKRLAPIDTGDLQMSISWTWGAAPKGSVVLAKSEPDSKGMRITIFAGSKEAFYARWQEFGTTEMPANPFFFPSWRALRKRIRSRIVRNMKKAVQAEFPAQ